MGIPLHLERVATSEYGSATWKISLWLCNDQGSYETFRSALRWGQSAEDTFHELFVDTLEDGMAKSVLQDLLGLVDWYEVESDLRVTIGMRKRVTTMSDDYSCDYCESAVEDLGLCLAHLIEELDYQLDEIEDPWPDFFDEPGDPDAYYNGQLMR